MLIFLCQLFSYPVSRLTLVFNPRLRPLHLCSEFPNASQPSRQLVASNIQKLNSFLLTMQNNNTSSEKLFQPQRQRLFGSHRSQEATLFVHQRQPFAESTTTTTTASTTWCIYNSTRICCVPNTRAVYGMWPPAVCFVVDLILFF